jgi:hypothetical protein
MRRPRKSARWSPADLALALAQAASPAAAPAKQAKHRNRKVTVDGVTWDSKGEYARYVELCGMQALDQISDLKHGVYFELAPACHVGGARKKPALRYKADFTYAEGGVLVVEDFKSAHTRTLAPYRMKKHLMMTVHGILIRESCA